MKRHLKRLAVPKTWNIKRKKTVFVTRPKPSGHKREVSTSINMFMKEIASLAKTTKEVKTILNTKNVLVDGRRRKDHRFAVGFLDTITIKETNDAYRVVLDNKGRLSFVNIPAKEANSKVCKITGKKMAKGKKIQITLNDGKNYFVDDKTKYKVGDSVVLDLKENKIAQHLPFEKNTTVFLMSGKNSGVMGKIIDMAEGHIIIKTKEGKEFKTRKANGFVIGKADAAVTVEAA